MKIPFTGDKFFLEEGNRLEPFVIEMYEKQTGIKVQVFKDRIFFNPENPIFQISLDGLGVLDNKPNRIVEVKCHWKPDKFKGADGKDFVPYDYYAQVQLQLYVFGLDRADIACYFAQKNKERFHTIPVYRNDKYINWMIGEGLKAWNEVEQKRIELKRA